MKAIIVGLCIALASSFTFAQAREGEPTVTIDGNEYNVNVSKLELTSRTVFACTDDNGDSVEPMFEVNDFDYDGDLDDECVGLKYNPCVYNSVRSAQIKRGHLGQACLTAEQHQAAKIARQQRKACLSGAPTFSPALCD